MATDIKVLDIEGSPTMGIDIEVFEEKPQHRIYVSWGEIVAGVVILIVVVFLTRMFLNDIFFGEVETYQYEQINSWQNKGVISKEELEPFFSDDKIVKTEYYKISSIVRTNIKKSAKEEAMSINHGYAD